MKIFFGIFSLGFLLVVSSAPLAPTGQSNFSLSYSISKFNSKFFEKICQAEDGNIFYSPFSIHMLLSQVYLGSPKNSTTNQELASLLELKQDDTPALLNSYLQARTSQELALSQLTNGSIVRIANKLYAAEKISIKRRFINSLEKNFKTLMERVNFANSDETAGKINSFVKNQTNGLITKIIDAGDIDGLSSLVLVNAIYFKGNWKHPFEKNETKLETFFVDGSTSTNFSAMTLTAEFKMIRVNEIEAEVIQLPYVNDKISMVIILPDKKSTVRQVETKLEDFDSTSLLEKVDSAVGSPVRLVLPKFETSFEVQDLEKMLVSLGLSTLFEPTKSNLSNISDQPLYVSKMSHKAVVKVNEEGSEAAAVTSVEIGIRATPGEFIVNRPFIFYIVDRQSNVPLFVGRIVDPNGNLKLRPNVVPSSGETIVRSGVVVEDPCDALGYNSTSVSPDSIHLPCPGHDTANLKGYQEKQESLKSQRLEEFNNRQS